MSASPITRRIALTYGSFAIATNSATYELHDAHVASGDYGSAAITFTVVVHDDGTGIQTLMANLEDAYSLPNQRLQLVVGGTTFRDWNPADNVHFLTRASWELLSSHRATEKSCAYQVTVRAERGADESGKGFRRSATIDLRPTLEGLSVVTISAIYTANSDGSTGARAQAQAAFPTYAGTIKSDLSITSWSETGGLVVESLDDEDKLARASQTFSEILLNEESGSAVGTTLKRPVYLFQVIRPVGRSSPGTGATPFVLVRASCSTGVDKDQSTDLDSVYRNTIKPYLDELAASKGNPGGPVYEVAEVFRPNPNANRIEASVDYVVPLGTLIEAEVERSQLISSGKTVDEVFDESPFAADVDQGPGVWLLDTAIRTVELAGSFVADDLAEAEIQEQEGRGFVHLTTRQIDKEVEQSIAGGVGATLDLVERARVLFFRYVQSDDTGGIPGGSGGGVQPIDFGLQGTRERR